MDLHPDFRDLLAEFAREGVRFVVVGGYAVGHYAKPRAIKDLDLLPVGRRTSPMPYCWRVFALVDRRR